MPSAEYILAVRTGPHEGRVFGLEKDIYVLGRDVTNDIILPDPEVSRRHSRLSLTPQGYVLEDLGSTNGTFVNGERLSEPRLLKPGDQIGLSQILIIAFETVSEASKTMPGIGLEGKAATVDTESSASDGIVSLREEFEVIEEADQGGRLRVRRWLFAGIGGVVLIAACGGLLWFLDARYDKILYAPLNTLMRILGLQ
ncbi:MAG: FHA domain-containing protein [Anaerolineales bacterium]|jgi:hypothetical protein